MCSTNKSKAQKFHAPLRYATDVMGAVCRGPQYFFSRTKPLLTIGHKYGKTAAQAALRYLIQRNVVVIPKSTHIERMKANIEVFDFSSLG